MTCPSDGELLESHRRGEAGAFTTLVLLHQATLLRHARAILGAGSPYEDVVQEVFLRLAQSPPVLPEEARGDPRLERAHLLSWLHKVTRNCCMDTIRSEGRRRRRESDAAPGEAAPDSHSGVTTVEELDTRAAVERELAKLPVDQREVLVLRLLGDRSYKEIAEITGKKIGTVGWLVSVGLKTLAKELEPLLEGGSGRNERAGLDVVRGEAQ
jgi:RNA polymerase sigma-70 factor, ECF subfamily